MWWRWRCLPLSASRFWTSCRIPVRSSLEPRAAGARLPARRGSSPPPSSDSQDKTETYEILRRPQGRIPLDRSRQSPSWKSLVPAAKRRGRGRHRQQIRQRDAAASDGPGYSQSCLAFLRGRRSQSLDVRLDLPGQELAGTALREPRCARAIGGLGDERREPEAPQSLPMMAASRQGPGFDETFAPGPHYSALVWRN